MTGRVVADRLVRDRGRPAQLLGFGHPERCQDLVLDEGAVLFPGPLLDELAQQVEVRVAVEGLRPGAKRRGCFATDATWACQGWLLGPFPMPLVMSSSSIVVTPAHLRGSLNDRVFFRYSLIGAFRSSGLDVPWLCW